MRDWRSYLYISGHLTSIYFLIQRYLLYFLAYSPPLQLFQLFEKYHCICIILCNYTDIYIHTHATKMNHLNNPYHPSPHLYCVCKRGWRKPKCAAGNEKLPCPQKKFSQNFIAINNTKLPDTKIKSVTCYFLKWFYLCCCVTVLHYCQLMAMIWT